MINYKYYYYYNSYNNYNYYNNKLLNNNLLKCNL